MQRDFRHGLSKTTVWVRRLLEGTPTDMDVHDAAALSAPAEKQRCWSEMHGRSNAARLVAGELPG